MSALKNIGFHEIERIVKALKSHQIIADTHTEYIKSITTENNKHKQIMCCRLIATQTSVYAKLLYARVNNIVTTFHYVKSLLFNLKHFGVIHTFCGFQKANNNNVLLVQFQDHDKFSPN